MPRLVILESPYAGDIPANVAYAKRAVRDALERGEAPIASHLLFAQEGLLDDADSDQRRQGIEAGQAWATVAHAMVVYTDRGISKGMQAAMYRAVDLGLPVEVREIGE